MSAIQTRAGIDQTICKFLQDLKDAGIHSKGESEPERDHFSDEEWDMLIEVRHQLHILQGMLNKVPA